ncbi:DMT family transporter [Lysinibacter sp. HNR]|uniref:DMT family transporter n=1 Tax=Lysinibacter sp. HNR TaxID=3031408 RepID=UPI002434CDFA|nr:DMT family transporter [Lysinibacter sp. HNR]WGD37002.1 DMT family transporter [Lysinibacter sp. HNR]
MTTKSRQVPLWIALCAVMLCGALVAVQTRITGQLGVALSDGFVAAAYSFGSGLLVISVLLGLSGSARAGVRLLWQALRAREFSVWSLFGGVAGAFLVLSQGVSAGILGVALFTVGVVAGQTAFAVVLDSWGVGPGGKISPTPGRVIGVLLCLCAVGVTVSGEWGDGGSLLWFIMPLVAGFGTAWQLAVNGRVRALAHSAIAATFVNFLVGTSILVIATAVRTFFTEFPVRFPAEPWLYLSGVIGCVFIGGLAILVKRTGVLLLGLASVSGQLICSLFLDFAFPLGNNAPTATTILGVVIALVAVVVSSASSRPRAR